MSGSTKWRIYVTSAAGNIYASLSEVQMRSSYGGPNLCSGGAVSASGTYSESFPETNAFDNDPSTYWASDSLPAWIGYEFPSAVSIAEVALRHAGTSSGDPYAFALQYWDGSAWVSTVTCTEDQPWGTELRVYNARPKMQWRLLCTEGNGSYTGVGELILRTVSGGPTVCTGGYVVGTTEYSASFSPPRAFDGSADSDWFGPVNSGYPHYVRYGFSEPQEILEYVVQTGASRSGFAPTAFKLQFNDGAGSWVDADVRTGQTWTDSQTRTFSFTPVTTVDPSAPGGGVVAAAARPQVFVCT